MSNVKWIKLTTDMFDKDYIGRPIIELRESRNKPDEQIEGQLTVFI